ncbi:MAG: amidohydrolase family protein [Methanomicrobiales archaeon]|nr:amidohydrolase family protein [Methanomicrobiales archaeon]
MANQEIFPWKKNPLVLTDVLVQGRRVDICIDEQGFIEAIGEGAGRAGTRAGIPCIEGKGAIAIPGLVNTHTHAAMTLLRGYADDMHLSEWLETRIWPLEAHLTGEDLYWGTRLACLEMIRTGTVAFNDMYFYMQDAARAVQEMGMKAVLSYGFIDLGDPDRREREIRATEELVAAVRRMQDPRIRVAVGPHAVYTVSREGLSWLAEFSRKEQLGIHIHLSETEKEVIDCQVQNGRRPPAWLESCGLLTPRTVVAHGCWLDREECALLGRKSVHISHNPQSNMKLAVNRAMPYPDLIAHGVNVTLGTDGCASNNSLDLFGTMKTAALLQKFFWNQETLLPAADVVAMATENGARALGTGSGRLEPGAPADLLLLSPDHICNIPLHRLESNLVYSCSGSAVDTVLCQGKVLMHERRVPYEKEILAGATKAAADLVRRSA